MGAEKCVAMIPARGGSKRIPRKNIIDFSGKPMIGYVIETAHKTELFDAILVSTEDEEIAEVAKKFGAEIIPRDHALAHDDVSFTDVCLDVIERRPAARFCCLYATAILLTIDDIIQSGRLLDVDPPADVVMGVSSYPIHPYKAMREVEGFLKPEWPDENIKQSQDFPYFTASNGTIYWARTDTFLRNRTFFPEKLRGYEVPPERAVDIDTPEDLVLARRLAKVAELGL